MTRNKQLLTALTIGSAMVCASPATAATFGTNNDGDGGFTSSTTTTDESFTIGTDSVTYANTGATDGGTKNSSFLGEFVLDRSSGNSYVVTGVLTMTNGYVDDNNRVGIYLFGETSEIPNEDEAGAIGVIFNTDDNVIGGAPGNNAQDNLNLRVGIDSTQLGGPESRNENTTPYAQDLFGTQITLTASIDFVGTDINIGASLIDADGDVTTIAPITVAAADYEGDYFGFVTRARNRGAADGRDAPWIMDYESFNIEVVPEPSSLALLGLGGLLAFRRRRGA